jgi:hypothetical protein
VREPVARRSVTRQPVVQEYAVAEPAVEQPAQRPAPTPGVTGIRRPGGMAAAVLTGLVVGLGMVGLTWAGLQLGEAVRGTSSWRGGGYPMLAAILALMAVVGGLLLKAARVRDPGSTSFLAVCLTAVVALLFLADVLLDPVMVVALPLISAGSYAASHWVTRTFVEPAQH